MCGPNFSPDQVTVVSVASPTSSATQKSVALPVNVALGQQILSVQQSTSPVKMATGQSAGQVRLKHGAAVTKVLNFNQNGTDGLEGLLKRVN